MRLEILEFAVDLRYAIGEERLGESDILLEPNGSHELPLQVGRECFNLQLLEDGVEGLPFRLALAHLEANIISESTEGKGKDR